MCASPRARKPIPLSGVESCVSVREGSCLHPRLNHFYIFPSQVLKRSISKHHSCPLSRRESARDHWDGGFVARSERARTRESRAAFVVSVLQVKFYFAPALGLRLSIPNLPPSRAAVQ